MKGEIGVAIDSNTGVCTMKVGDGVHRWNDLTLELGQKKPSNTCSHSYAIGYSTIDTLQELANYIDNQKITTIETREEPARSQSKDLRSDLKTLSSAFEAYNLTEAHSDINFDF